MRLKELRIRKGLTQEQMAERAELSTAHYNRIEKARRPVSTKWLQRFATILGVEMSDILGQPEVEKPRRLPVQTITVIGSVQGGAWVEAMDWPVSERYDIVVPELPDSAQSAFGLVVRGPSMNREYPDGSIVVCVPLIDHLADLKSGDHVVVERRENGGIEATVKELQIDADGHAWLWPRSDHPRHQQPLETGWPLADPESGAEIVVTAVVVGSYRAKA